MGNRNGVLLASGGMDSTTLAYYFERENVDIVPLFIDYGQHCADTELETLKKVLPQKYLPKLEIMNVSDIYKKSSSRFINEADLWKDEVSADDLYLPYRNVLLLSIGATLAQVLGYRYVYSAFINSNHAKEIDCSKEFFTNMEGILGEYGSVKLSMPFQNYSKYEVAQLGLELGVDIGYTFSCQASSDVPCGVCPNCVDRLEALKKIENKI